MNEDQTHVLNALKTPLGIFTFVMLILIGSLLAISILTNKISIWVPVGLQVLLMLIIFLIAYYKPIALSSVIEDTLDEAREDKKSYTQKLEEATGDGVFKYLLLLNTSALEAYIAQTRLQAEQSFRTCKIVAIVGFALLVAGITIGLSSNFLGKNALDAAYLASISGIITEFISGVFFYLYNKTLQQFNLFPIV